MGMNTFEQGRTAFYKWRITSPYNRDTYNDKEWQRGFNRGYFDNLERVKANEHRKGSKRTYDGSRKNRR